MATSEEHACLNEVVVARGSRVRMIQLEVEVSGSHLATYVADAVVVATPTGSTAYSFSAGGSILDPRLRNMVITPVAGYLSPLHSVVAGEDHVVDLTLREAARRGARQHRRPGGHAIGSATRSRCARFPSRCA